MATSGIPGLPDGPAREGREAVRDPFDVLDSLAASIAIIDEAGTILAVNRAWRRFAAANAPAGARVAEGTNYLRACDEAEGEDAEVAAAFAQGICDVLAGRRAEFAREYPCHGPGCRRWFIGRVTRLGDGPRRALLAHEDITERKLMEESLARSEARLRTVLDHVHAAIFLKDLEGRYLLVNRLFAELFDVGEEWVIGKSDRDFLPAGIADRFRANDRQALEALAPTEFEEVVTHADGPRTSLVIKVPLRGADGAPFAVCGIATDITERKKTELALRESESVLRSFYDGVPVALAVAEVDDEDVRVISANATMARLLGCPASETPDHQVAGLEIPDEHRRRWLAAHQEASCTGRPARFELVWATREGRGWFAAMVNPIAVEPGARPRFWVTIENITERKESEREIFVLNAELEERLERITSLREIDQAITGSLDLPLTLGIVVDQVRSRLEVDAAGILLRSPQAPAFEYAVRKGYRAGPEHGPAQRLDEGPAGRAVLECRTQRAAALSDIPSRLVRGEGFVAYWAVPLVVKGESRGVLEVGHRSQLDPEPEWLEYIEALARQAAIAVDNAGLLACLRRSNLELSLAYDATIEGWSRAMDLRDHDTEGHSRRVTEMTLRLCRALGMSDDELVHIRRGALLHDIGKIGIPDAILLKPSELSDDERAVIRRHPRYALEMLSPIAFLRPALAIPHCHHERWDGAGYPNGLRGEEIPLAARAFAAVDIWDALRSDRPYRPGWPMGRILEHLRSLAGTHLDPHVVETFLATLSAEPTGP